MKAETELAERVIAWLEAEHWDVYQEVPWRGRTIDIVAVRCGIVWAIECKLALNLKVLAQVAECQTHRRSVAVPAAKRATDERALCKRVARQMLHAGVIEVTDWGRVDEETSAPLLRHHHDHAKRLRAALRPEHKTFAKAGAATGSAWTPYRSTMDTIKKGLAATPEGVTLRELMAWLAEKHHYRSDAIARSCIPTALRSWESSWCEVRGEGRDARFFLRGKS